ncbi:MAG: dihydrodipicolinate synthase family protein [Chthoniobacterales bacterium]
MKPIAGVLPVVQVPFLEDFSIDRDSLQREIDWLYECGVQGVVVGMVSEAQRLTDVERTQLNTLLVEMSAGRGPVVASGGAESICQAIAHANAAEAVGVSAIMVIPPALTKCNPDELLRYYSEIVTKTTVPIIVQDASGYLGNPIPIDTQARIFHEFGERILFKPEAPPIGPNLTALHVATNGKARIFEGTGGMALVDSYRRGIVGTMPGSDVPWALVKLWKALEADDEKRIAAIHSPLCALIALMVNLDAFLAIEKLLLVDQGIFANTRVRGPVAYHLDEYTTKEARRLFTVLREACQ